MPRSSRRSGGSARSAPPPASSGQRGYSSTAAAHPPAQAHPQQQAGAGAQAQAGQRPPGLLAQAASTMGGAMAGSVIGHGISNMFFGGRSQEQMPPPEQYAQQALQQTGGCDIPSKDFTKCLDATNGDMSSCSYYLEALKACQAAAKNY